MIEPTNVKTYGVVSIVEQNLDYEHWYGGDDTKYMSAYDVKQLLEWLKNKQYALQSGTKVVNVSQIDIIIANLDYSVLNGDKRR